MSWENGEKAGLRCRFRLTRNLYLTLNLPLAALFRDLRVFLERQVDFDVLVRRLGVHDKNLQRAGFAGLFWQKYLVDHIFAGYYPSVSHESEISFVSLVAFCRVFP